jgi:hypothetical protein
MKLYKQIFNPTEADRNRTRTLPHRATDQDLVSEQVGTSSNQVLMLKGGHGKYIICVMSLLV